jgi:hypothetical protein
MSVTFRVDDVAPAASPPTTQSLSAEDGAALPVVGHSLAEILERALDTSGAKV